METYEEKYKKAIEVVEKYRGTHILLTEDLIEEIFPELKESEGERIRKELIDTINLAYDCGISLNKNQRNRYVAWLEKQGDKVSAIEGFETEFERQVSGLIASAINKEHEYNQGYVKWTANALLNYAKYELEKQGEQKCTAEEVLIKAGLKPYKDGDQWCILLGDNIQEGICGFGDTIDDALYAFLNDLIKSQKEQKPAEWSEEDEYHKRQILRILKESGCTQTLQNKTEKWIEGRLKSLRPQSQWKPSEEQMHTLEAAIADYTEQGLSYVKDSLNNLYEQLKKL
jgi:hypothetical protein